MPNITSNQGLTIPDGDDANNIPGIFISYNAGVENRLVQRYLSSADRLVRNPTPTTGEVSYLLDAAQYDAFDETTGWTQLITAGFVGETVRSVSAATFTTTETVIDTLTFTAIPYIRYMVKEVLNYQSSVANDLVQIRLRWQAGATLTTAGTQFHSVLMNCDIANRGAPATLIRTITGLSGQVTLGTTAVRSSGTGTITMFGSTTQNNVLIVTAL